MCCGVAWQVEGVSLVVDTVTGATGLELKNDPGVPLVYAGYGGLMITTLVSYLSHSQVWALQQASMHGRPGLLATGRATMCRHHVHHVDHVDNGELHHPWRQAMHATPA